MFPGSCGCTDALYLSDRTLILVSGPSKRLDVYQIVVSAPALFCCQHQDGFRSSLRTRFLELYDMSSAALFVSRKPRTRFVRTQSLVGSLTDLFLQDGSRSSFDLQEKRPLCCADAISTGLTKMKDGKYESAIAAFTMALSVSPDSECTHSGLY